MNQNDVMWYTATQIPFDTKGSDISGYAGEEDIAGEFESNFSLNLFSGCRKSCKEQLGGKGPGFDECIRGCKGKGDRKSTLATKQAESDKELADALKSASTDSSDVSKTSSSSSKTFLWILFLLMLVAVIITVIWIIRKKKQQPA